MSNQYLVMAKINDPKRRHLVLGVSGTPPAPDNTHLDMSLPPLLGPAPNQLWTFVADASNPGYFFIQNVQDDKDGNPLYVDIHDASASKLPVDGKELMGRVRGRHWWENQLWMSVLNPDTQASYLAGSQFEEQYIFIQSFMDNSAGQPMVMDVQGWQPGNPITDGNLVDAFPQKSSNADNQLWQILAAQGNSKLVPELLPFSDFQNLADGVTNISFTGQGFKPGAVLVLQAVFENTSSGTFTTKPPILCVSDLGGNISANGPILSGDQGILFLSVFRNGDGTGTPVATAHQSWNGEFFEGEFTTP